MFAACSGAASEQSVPVIAVPDVDAGQAQGEETATSPSMAPTCHITPAFLDANKACKVDADCVAVPYRTSCCKTAEIAGVASADADAVRACAANAPNECACQDAPNRAEDGRASQRADFSDVVARCVEGSCKSEVAARSCGAKLQCKAGELCVQYDNVPGTPVDPSSGDNALYSYACVPNPCADALDCSCAQSVCDAKGDVPRLCQYDLVTDADLSCTRQQT